MSKQKNNDTALLSPEERKKMLEEEQIHSPVRTMVNTFLNRKLSIVGMIGYLVIFLACMILPFFYPVDLAYQDSSQQNIRPGFFFMNVPSQLEGHAKKIDGGGNYAIGVSEDGKLYLWGNLSQRLRKLPSDMGSIVDVSAGLDHVVAVNDQGELFTWGSNRFGLDKIPFELQGANIKQIHAGYQTSIVVTEDGQVHIWGNESIVNVDPRKIQGEVDYIASNNATAIALLKDGSVASMTNKESHFRNIPDIDGKVVDIAMNNRVAAAVNEKGQVYIWGDTLDGTFDVPEHIQGQVKAIAGGSLHFSALLQDGSAVSWGSNMHKQANAPSISNGASINGDYYQTYVVDNKGNIEKWGLKGYLMGTDQFGRDLFARLLTGGRTSLVVGIISVVISGVIGIILGGLSGYYGGRIDFIIMRFAEVVAGLPFLPIAIVLSFIIGNSISQQGKIFLIMAIQGFLVWPSIARLVRGQILSTREEEFVTAAQAMGVREWSIIFRHIFPNIIGPIIVTLTIRLASSILYESSLSFLGFGINEPIPSWGNMLTSTIDLKVIRDYWWRWIFPGATLSIVILSINLMGDGLRDAIDPKSQER